MHEIHLDGPGKNALSTELMASILSQLQSAAGTPVLLTGTGNAFCAGLDLKEVQALDTPGTLPFLRGLDAFFSEVARYPGPLVAAVNGHAIAGGCVLALCCDHRVLTTAPKARMGVNEVALGLEFPPATLRICRARVHRGAESEVLLGADLFAPPDALRVGLVDELAEDPVARARARLELLARHPAGAYAACKRALRAEAEPGATDENALAALLGAWASPALKARLSAVLAKKDGRA